MIREAMNRRISIVLRVCLGVLFLYAGALKLFEPLNFADNIASFQLLPTAIINPFAVSLPVFEMIVGGMLVLGWRDRMAGLMVCGMGCLFSLALGQALIRGLQVDCNCFGSGAASTTRMWIAFGRALLFIGAGYWLWCLRPACQSKLFQEGLQTSLSSRA